MPFWPPASTRRPSERRRRDQIGLETPSNCLTSPPLATSRILSVLSWPPERACVPSVEMANEPIRLLMLDQIPDQLARFQVPEADDSVVTTGYGPAAVRE